VINHSWGRQNWRIIFKFTQSRIDVHCVTNLLDRRTILISIVKFTQAKSCTSVRNALSHLVILLIWRGTCKPTPVRRDRMSVWYVLDHLPSLTVYKFTWEPTLERNLSDAMNVVNHLPAMAAYRSTCKLTLARNLSNVPNVLSRFQILDMWKFTWELTLERNPSGVLNVRDHFQILIIWDVMWEELTLKGILSDVLNVLNNF
jgi:hypothetical protein